MIKIFLFGINLTSVKKSVLYHHSSRLVTVERIIILLSEELENAYFLIIRSFEFDSKRTFSIDAQFSNGCDSMISIELGIGMVFMIRTQKIVLLRAMTYLL